MENTAENQENKEPKVKIFNEEVSAWGSKKKDTKAPTWKTYWQEPSLIGEVLGVIILVAGILLLLSNLGLISKDIWSYIVPLWPVLLIFLGIRMLDNYSRVGDFVIFLLELFLLIMVLLYILVHSGSPLVYDLNLSPEFINFIKRL